VADITYIRLQSEFVYLAVILDAFSRNVVGWTLERTMATRLTKTALERASLHASLRQAWSIIPIVVCSTPQMSTYGYCKHTR
jgi:transposase InsO family protein